MRATFPTYRVVYGLIHAVIRDQECTLWTFSLCCILHIPVTLSL